MSSSPRVSCGEPRSIRNTHTPSSSLLAGTLQATPMLLSDVLWQDDIPLFHLYTSPVRPGCRTAGFGLIRGIPSGWRSCGDPSSRLLATIGPAAVVISSNPIPSRSSFLFQFVSSASQPGAPYDEPSSIYSTSSTRYRTGTRRGSNDSLSPITYPPGFVRHAVKVPSRLPA